MSILPTPDVPTPIDVPEGHTEIKTVDGYQKSEGWKTKKESHLSEIIMAEISSKVTSYGTVDQQSNSPQFTDQKNRGNEVKNFHKVN